MQESEKTDEREERQGTLLRWLGPVIGAAFGLVLGLIFVSQGFWDGLWVLLLTVLGALAGWLYAGSE